MPFSGSAPNRTFSRTTGLQAGSTAWALTEATGRGIEETDHDTHDQDMAAAINTSLQKNGDNKPTANIDWGGFQLKNLGEPTAGSDATTKDYVDGVATGSVNFTVRLASTANVNLTTDVDAGSTFDGTALVEADRILLKNQTDASENGIYAVPAALGTATRVTDMDTWAEVIGAIVNVTAGSTNAATSWRSTANTGGTLDTTDLNFVAFGTSVTLPLGISSGGTGATTAAAAFSALKQNASESATGVVELATTAEAEAGVDTSRAVTAAGVAAAIAALATLPFGSVTPYAGASAPSGWLLCYGQAISRTTYSDLFSAISTTYGSGDGSTTFNVPDLRGRVVAGQDDMGGTSANRLTNQSGGLNGDTLGATGGSETHALTQDEMPAGMVVTSPDSNHYANGDGSNNVGAATSGAADAHNNVQPTIILNYIIYTGV